MAEGRRSNPSAAFSLPLDLGWSLELRLSYSLIKVGIITAYRIVNVKCGDAYKVTNICIFQTVLTITHGDAWCWAVSTETHKVSEGPAFRGKPSRRERCPKKKLQDSVVGGLAERCSLGLGIWDPLREEEQLELGTGRQTRWSVPGP